MYKLPSSFGVTSLVNIDLVAIDPAPCIISTIGPEKYKVNYFKIIYVLMCLNVNM